MPRHAPRICSCGAVVAHGVKCSCQIKRDGERKRRSDKRRPSAHARGYTSKWETARQEHLTAHPSCIRCRAPAVIVDHIAPHRGDEKLFWQRSNWQSLCASCHSGWKQRQEHSRDR